MMGTLSPEDAAKREENKSVENLLQQVVKTVKTLKLYPLTNPIAQRFLKELHSRFVGHLDEYGLLKLGVQQHELLHDGQIVYQEPNRRESLALKFFLDGIAELVFHEGLDEEELKQFLEFLGRDDDRDKADDDLATLLWGAHFAHIGFTIAEAYAEEPPPLRPSRGAQAQPDLKQVVREEVGSAAAPLELPPPSVQDAGLELFQISAEELKRLKAEMEVDGRAYSIGRLIEMLTAILAIEEDAEAFREPVEIMERILADLTGKGDWFHSTMILEALRRLGKGADLSEARRKRLAAAIDAAGSPERIEAIGRVLEKGGEKAAEGLPSVLGLLHKNALLPLCEFLGWLESTKLRTMISDALLNLGKQDSAVLASKLTDGRWTLVRDLVSLLGRMDDPAVVDRFRGLVNHRRAEVRKEVVRVVQPMKGPKAGDLLLCFLHDPEEGIRVSAVKGLAQAGHQAARDPLLEIVQSKGCKGKSFYEKTSLFDALGRIGGDGAIPTLERILKKRTWFFLRDPKQSELAVCAALALRRIGTPAAVSVLEDGLTLRDKAVREACAKAVAAMKGEMRAGKAVS